MAMENLLIKICFIVMLVHLSAGGEIEIAVIAGQNTTLPCIFEGIPWHVKWLKEDSPSWNIIASYGGNTNSGTIDDGKYSVQENFSSGKSSFSLSIAEMEIADAGRYSCAVTDLNGTLSTELRKKTYNIKLLDALNTSVTIPAPPGSTPTPPASTLTVTTTTTDSRNQTVDDTGSGISLAAKLGIAFGGILTLAVFAFVINKVYRNRNPKAVQQRLPQPTSLGSPMYQLSLTTDGDDNENEAVNETVC